MAVVSGAVAIKAEANLRALGRSIFAFALTTLDRAKRHMFIRADNHDHDDFIESLIGDVTEAIERKTDRKLAKRAYVNDPREVSTDGSGTDVIWLMQWPVFSVEKVNLGFGSNDVPSTGFAVYPDAAYIRIQERLPLTFDTRDVRREVPFGVQNVRVDYTAGYDPIPRNLQLAADIAVERFFSQSPRGQKRSGLKSRGGENVTESFVDESGLPKATLDMLISYTRIGFALNRNTAVGDQFT